MRHQKTKPLRHSVRKLESWYMAHHRKLPWRASHNPYSIWVSEVMLQQTQVTTVLPYYQRFLQKWPTLQHLAESDETELLAAWSGLGYYSRARNLRRGARHLMDHHDGTFPHDPATLKETPGIGPYTAGAILSIAFDLAEPLVDGNVQRVFARFYGEERHIEERDTQKQFWKWARDWVMHAESPRALNQALMELGATVCTKSSPKCSSCPVKDSCFGNLHQCPETFPRRRPRRKVKELYWLGVVFEQNNKLLLRKNPTGGWWQDLWDFPTIALGKKSDLKRARTFLQKHYPQVGDWTALAPQKHSVTHHRIHLHPFVARITNTTLGKVPASERWWAIDKIDSAPTSSLVKKVMRAYY
ncbi:MAG: A/G-specific adenine glycosylase [Bdellovibrionales bacterium]|nr:A/G-specific adenine glycosylase [Bdellovibrionales bacterium]